MGERNIATDYIMFNGISKMIEHINNIDGEQLNQLESLENYYTKNYGHRGECLLRKLSMIRNDLY
ncbi:hypothetical protein [Tepidibacter aestuarii]|uniref:hypothetical protein n=1 Tax=Tepidibacter aestuarii TaxID=2925782 RepID=UPI0020BD6F7A|nr:hypothetical protein [Tepidibacter aestuarii]CAH2213254.1 conserved protein of unknown function [Tepidibacter aestuarii]